MKRKTVGFHLDLENHWVAELDCGHGQHVRHDPPMVEREWVLTESGRASKMGVELNCVRCDELAELVKNICIKTLKNAYDDAGMSGLCEEGRLEAAISALQSLDIKKIIL